MQKKIFKQWIAVILILVMALAGCAAPAQEESSGTVDQSQPVTLGSLADYFIKAADDYHPGADRAAVLEGLDPAAQAKRLEMFVLASRAFGELPEPSGNGKNTAPPPVDVSRAPEWSQGALSNLSKGGVLAASDLNLAQVTAETGKNMEDPVTWKEAEMLAQRFFQIFGTNLKDNFYATVNKGALDALEIPEGSEAAGGSSTVAANTNRQLHDLILEIVNSTQEYPQGSAEQKIRDLYNNVLDVEARNQEGIQPLRKYFDAVDQAENFAELYAAIAMAVNELGNLGNGLFAMVSVTDSANSSQKVMQLMTLSPMFTQEDYDDPQNAMVQEYRAQMVQQLMAAGESEEEAQRHADELLRMERELAGYYTEYSWLQTENRRYTPEILDEMMSQAKPSQLLYAIGLKSDTPMQVFDDQQFAAYAKWFTEENLEIFKSQQKIALVSGFSAFLSEELAQTFGYASGSAQEQANEAVQLFLSEELGQLYVSRYFPPEAKAQIEQMVQMMIEAFKSRIGRLDWMEESTKQEAIKKLDSITVLIGYPDEWDFNPAQIQGKAQGGSYFANAAASEAIKWKRMVEGLKEPVNPRRFMMPAYTVNAAASRSTNTLIFPAGILQAPFYDVNASFEENLGAIGSTIAHEITHMFDDGGAQYDASGTVRNWWSDSDLSHFQKLCGRVEEFYEGREAAPGIPTDGKMTLSENISDIGGIACGLEILSGMENPDYDAFFRSYVRYWLKAAGYDTLAELAQTDEHAPNILRCNQVLSNFQEFFDTYGIGPGDGMYVAPEERVAIW